MTPSNIHEDIAAVMQSVGYVQKTKSPGLTYTYAGEASLIEALRPPMVEAGIYCYVADLIEINETQFETAKGTPMNQVSLTAVVRFMHTPSGTFIDVKARGTGMDTGDKAGNKAATGAYKYALRQTFCIETGDDPDKDPSEEQARAGHTGNGSGNGRTTPVGAKAQMANGQKPAGSNGQKPALVSPAPQPTPTATAVPADDSGNYLIPVGKNAGKKLSEMSATWLEWAANTMATTTPETTALQAAVKAYLVAKQPVAA